MNKFRALAAVFSLFAIALLVFGINYVSNAESVELAAIEQFQSDESDILNKYDEPIIHKGERFCATDHNPQKIAAAEIDFAERLEKMRDTPGVDVNGGVINVYFHVINKRHGHCQRRHHYDDDQRSDERVK